VKITLDSPIIHLNHQGLFEISNGLSKDLIYHRSFPLRKVNYGNVIFHEIHKKGVDNGVISFYLPPLQGKMGKIDSQELILSRILDRDSKVLPCPIPQIAGNICHISHVTTRR
jgi:hypothetical protein